MEYLQKLTTIRDATLAAAATEYSDPVDCTNSLQAAFFIDGTLAYPIADLMCTINTDTSLVDQDATGHFTSGMVGMTVTGSGIDTGTTVSSVTNATTIVLNKSTLSSQIDVSNIMFAHTSIGLASVTVQVSRDGAVWNDKADALCVQQAGGTGTTGLTDGSCVVVATPKNSTYIPWSQMRLKLVGHATKLTPALKVVASVVTTGATPMLAGEIKTAVVI